MGFLSFVGDAIGSIVNPVKSILDPVSSLLDLASTGKQAYNTITGDTASANAIAAQIRGQEETNKFNRQLMWDNWDWQKQMSSTAHQREVADLEAAGLNPVLSATGGNGASTPSGGVIAAQNPHAGEAEAVNTARRIGEIEKARIDNENRMNKKQLDIADTQVRLNEAGAESSRATALKNTAEAYKAAVDSEFVEQNKELNRRQADTQSWMSEYYRQSAIEKATASSLNSALGVKARHETERIDADTDWTRKGSELRGFDINEREIDNKLKKYLTPADSIINSASGVKDLINPFNFGVRKPPLNIKNLYLP